MNLKSIDWLKFVGVVGGAASTAFFMSLGTEGNWKVALAHAGNAAAGAAFAFFFKKERAEKPQADEIEEGEGDTR